MSHILEVGPVFPMLGTSPKPLDFLHPGDFLSVDRRKMSRTTSRFLGDGKVLPKGVVALLFRETDL